MVDERERGKLGKEMSVEIGRWNLHTSYNLREDVCKTFTAEASGQFRQGRKKVE